VCIGGDPGDPGQAAGDEVRQVAVPPGPGLRGGGGDAEDLAEPVGVDAGGDHDRDLDDPPALADLPRSGIVNASAATNV
jgi:hypothetical protein